MTACPACARTLKAPRRVCGYCGVQVGPARPPRVSRRRITIVQSDLKGSTSLGERLDPESLREVLSLYFAEMRSVLEAHGGTIEKIIGDAIVAVFGFPVSHPDDALRAVVAAAETQRTLGTLNDQLDRRWGVRLTNRTGVATGDAIIGAAGAGQHIITGDVVRLAAKLEQSAPPMEVLLGEPTMREIDPDVQVEAVDAVLPSGAAIAVPAYRLIGVDAEAEARADLARTRAASARGRCQACGRVNPADFTYCGACGSRLEGQAAGVETRKVVTIVFSDLKGSTVEGGLLAPAVGRSVMARAFDVARLVIERHGGTVEKFIGDAIMAVFGLPVRHEDDALRALRTAWEMGQQLSALATELEGTEGVRLIAATGVNTGEVVAGDASLGQRLVTGDAVNVAARLEQAANAHEVLLGGLTYELVRDAVEVADVEPLTLKGKADPVPAFRLLGVKKRPTSDGRETPLVGRRRELTSLKTAYRQAKRAGACRMVTLVGEAGVGKSRLTQEFLEGVRGEALIVQGRCLAYGEAITFWPIVELVRQAAGIADDDDPIVARGRLARLMGAADEAITDRVAAAVGLTDTPYQIAELFWGIRGFLEVLAADKPVVVLFEDIHWAESTFLELVRHLVDTVRSASLMVLCTARHTLIDDHEGWATRHHERRVELAPLAAADSERIVANLLGDSGIDHRVRARIVSAAEGNPLFVEQLLSMLIERGVLRSEDGRWVPTSDLSKLDIPPSIHALLAARLDQLSGGERAVVDAASVIGLSFAQAAVAELAPSVAPRIPAHLLDLERKQLVRAIQVAGEADPGHRFQHVLVRDAAYQGLLKRTRALYHERFVAWADRVNARAGRGQEFEEILGYHLEQTYRYLAELGPLDPHGVDIGLSASARLSSAARRAFARGDMPAAANMFERAESLVPADHDSRPWLGLRLGEARFEMGQYEAAHAALAEAASQSATLGDRSLETHVRLERLLISYLTDPTSVEGNPEDEVRGAIPFLEAGGDHGGLATAWRLIVNLRSADAQWGASGDAARRWIEQARLAGDQVMEVRAGTALALAALFGPTPVPLAIAQCRELLARSKGDRRSEALIRRDLAHLDAMEGRFDEARDGYRWARRTLDELGWTFQASLTSLDSGPIELLAGDPAAAEHELRRDFDALDLLKERNYISTVAAILADALYGQDRLDEADQMSAFSAEVAAPDDLTTQFLWRGVRGKLLARMTRVEDGLAMLREALALTRRSDEPIAPANALMDLAETLAGADRHAEAHAAIGEALALYEAKGNAVAAERARAFRRTLMRAEPDLATRR